MADLNDSLPDFDLQPWRHLTYSLQKKNVTTVELISLDPSEVARKCPLPLREVKRMAAAVRRALQEAQTKQQHATSAKSAYSSALGPGNETVMAGTDIPILTFVKTLDAEIDHYLGGGFPVGKLCEIAGQSAAGKTQFALSLLLSAQLPAPKGLGRNTLYISTEGLLNTTRLAQILESNPEYEQMTPCERPSMDRVLAMTASSIEAQDRLIHYQLPYLVAEQNVGLLVIDSITANFRVAFQGFSPKVLSSRAKSMRETATILRKIAHEQRTAIVLINQVSDRFDDEKTIRDKIWVSQRTSTPQASTKLLQSSARQSASQALSVKPSSATPNPPCEEHSLDYQQRFFTGWGHDPRVSPFASLKTPALGMSWATHLDGRVVLKVQEYQTSFASKDGHIWSDSVRQRTLHLAFASWTDPASDDIHYSIKAGGICSGLPEQRKVLVTDSADEERKNNPDVSSSIITDEHAELLDPRYWEDSGDEFS